MRATKSSLGLIPSDVLGGASTGEDTDGICDRVSGNGCGSCDGSRGHPRGDQLGQRRRRHPDHGCVGRRGRRGVGSHRRAVRCARAGVSGVERPGGRFPRPIRSRARRGCGLLRGGRSSQRVAASGHADPGAKRAQRGQCARSGHAGPPADRQWHQRSTQHRAGRRAGWPALRQRRQRRLRRTGSARRQWRVGRTDR